MRLFFFKRILTIAILFFIFFIIKHFIALPLVKNDNFDSQKAKIIPTIVWWTKILENYDRIKQCGLYKCRFTVDQNLLTNANVKAFAFYGSDLKLDSYPLPRRSTHLWALFHEESPKNVPYVQFEPFLKHFNFTATFSRYSDFPLTTQYIDNYELLRTQEYIVPVGEKSKLRIKNIAPVAFVQSICDTISGRDQYVKELMKYIEIDSYGKCLNNRKLPESLSKNYLQTIDSAEFYKFLARYKFIISYENGICMDYISEKFWRPLIIGSIPLYFGSPSIKDWMPNNKSIILISDFETPKKLAEYLKYLDGNDYEYNQYLGHKYAQIDPITNEMLKKTLIDREYSTNENLIENFECFLCKQLYENNKIISMANRSHYDCDIVHPNIDGYWQDFNDWQSIINNGKCQANVLNTLLTKNRNYSTKDFEKQMISDINSGKCIL